MPLRVLIAPDKFKGTLTAAAAAAAMAEGWRQARPQDEVRCLPISDGGDGFGEVLSSALGAVPMTLATVDAAHRPLTATWWWEPRQKMAIIESARIIGLALLPRGQFHPRQLDTYGLGAALRAAAEKGARRCLVGIGGSATNDAGFGLARSLGWTFWDAQEQPLESWTELARLQRVAPPRRRLPLRITVAVDVQNRLLGPRGCTRIYGPQKGLGPADFAPAEAALRRLARVMQRARGRALHREPGSGAAGGLGFGLMAFLHARLAPGFALLARQTRLAQALRWADVVLTGEGALDASSLMGKGVGELARWCVRRRLPCLGLAGVVRPSPRWRRWFTGTLGLTDLTTPEEAQARAAYWVTEGAARLAAQFSAGRTVKV
jgi:glycerate kinase